jgi:peptidase E
VLCEAWESGIVLGGVSAGAICWFEGGVTDSFRVELDGIDCLGWLAGSCCPHYDGEEQRRPAYARLVADGFPSGIAIDDGVTAVYEGTELAEVVTARPGATAYRVDRDGETALEARLLT